VRAGQDRLERAANAALEAALCRPLLVKRHQPIDLAADQRPPIRLAAEPGEDLARARPLFRGARRPAGENLLPARGLRDAGGPGRPLDDEIAHVRQRRDAGSARATAGKRPFVRANQIFVRSFELAHERRGDPVLPGANHDRLGADNARPAAVGAAGGAGLVFDQRDAFAVDGDVDVLEARVAARVDRHLEDVFSVSREDVLDDHAAARAVRRTLEVIPGMLRQVTGVGVGGVDWRCVAIADRHRADCGRRVEVGLEQGRRQRLHVGDVVEVGALLIERQPAAGVDLEVDEIAHRARVFGAIEPLERAHAGVRLAHPRGVDGGFERGGERGRSCRIRPRRERRRHHAGLQLTNHLLGDVRVLRRLGHVEGCERQAAGLARVAVAADAVTLDHRVVIGSRCGRRRHGFAAALRKARRVSSPRRLRRRRSCDPLRDARAGYHAEP
jgi:hypothetical protein